MAGAVDRIAAAHPHAWWRWRRVYCWLMNLLDFRLWHCECEYVAPYGRVTMAGCPKHEEN